jgi:hypothetical protein
MLNPGKTRAYCLSGTKATGHSTHPYKRGSIDKSSLPKVFKVFIRNRKSNRISVAEMALPLLTLVAWKSKPSDPIIYARFHMAIFGR